MSEAASNLMQTNNGTVTNWKIVLDPAVQMNGNNAYFTISYMASVK